MEGAVGKGEKNNKYFRLTDSIFTWLEGHERGP